MAESAERYHQRRRRRPIGIGVLALLVGGVIVDRAIHHDDVVAFFSTETFANVGSALMESWRDSVLNPWYIGLVLVLVIAERIFTADPQGGTLTRGGATDLAWLVAFPLTSLTLVALWLGGLEALYFDDLGGAVVDLPAAIGWSAAIIVAFLIGDFFQWLTHYIRHKIPTFWYFHAVHHSQPQMGVLTDNRVHFVEAIISGTIVFIPSILLGLGSGISIILALGTVYFTGFTHANMRTNLGPLRYLVITPQFHRVHHSYAPEHIDKNFGAVLSIWDRMLGTAYLGEDEYPHTGIDDPGFPLETSANPLKVARNYLRQLVYPFRQCAADVAHFELGRGDPKEHPAGAE